MHVAHYHLPGLFEFYELYRVFLPLFREHREYFYSWCDIGSIYGAPVDCVWGGGRVGFGENDPREVLALMQEYGISARLTFSNSLLREEHLLDKTCNRLCALFDETGGNGVIVHSDLLLEYLKGHYPNLYFVSSTTKVLTDFRRFLDEVNREDFRYVVPDFRLNKAFDNRYAVGNTNEAEQCRKIATKLVEALNRCGFDGKTNVTGDMYEHVRESNAFGADLHIPIHTNAYNGKVAGLRIFVYKTGGEAEKIAKAVSAELAPITPGTSDGISAQPGLYECKATNALCVYIESGFHDNPTEAQWIIDHTVDIAEAICRGLCKYYGLKYVTGSTTTPSPSAKPESASTAPAAECSVELLVLRKGSQGAPVKALQNLLIGNGCSCGSYGADGDFGAATDTALKAYQKSKGITVDGIAGAETWNKLLKG